MNIKSIYKVKSLQKTGRYHYFDFFVKNYVFFISKEVRKKMIAENPKMNKVLLKSCILNKIDLSF